MSVSQGRGSRSLASVWEAVERRHGALGADPNVGVATTQASSSGNSAGETQHGGSDSPPNEEPNSNRVADAAKRIIDIVGACIGLVIGLPLLAVSAVSVRLDTSGPAIFKQTRVGRFGQPFVLYKFRGMYFDAPVRFPELYRYRYGAKEVAGLKFHVDADPRVTRVGRVLRRMSIDELPNLWNVLKGDMSLVGPRPEIPEMLPYYGAAAGIILSVKPGVTSLAKVNGRDQLTFSETLRYEIHYVRVRSILVDMKILLRTVTTLWQDGLVR